MKKLTRAKIIIDHVIGLTNNEDYGIFPPPMKYETAIVELCRYFLGDDWYSDNPISGEQIVTEIVYEIENKYSGNRKRWKKIVKNYFEKQRRNKNVKF